MLPRAGSHGMNRWKKRGLEFCPGPAVGRAELALGPMPVLEAGVGIQRGQ